MSQSLAKNLIHQVFSTKDRKPLIQNSHDERDVTWSLSAVRASD